MDDKELLRIDLSGRLPYNVVIWNTDPDDDKTGFKSYLSGEMLDSLYNGTNFFDFKPFLRKIEDITESELIEFAKLRFENQFGGIWKILEFSEMKKDLINVKCKNKKSGNTWTFQVTKNQPLDSWLGIDFLNSKHIDFRGLIPRKLAIRVTPENNPYDLCIDE